MQDYPLIPLDPSKFSFFEVMPDELTLNVFSYIADWKSLCQTELTCRKWKALAFDHVNLRELFLKAFPNEPFLQEFTKLNCLKQFVAEERIRSNFSPTFKTITGPKSEVKALKIINGKIISGTKNGYIEFRDFDGRFLHALPQIPIPLISLAIDNDRIIADGFDSKIQFFNFEGASLFSFNAPDCLIIATACHERKVMVACIDNTVSFWDNNETPSTFTLDGPLITAIDFNNEKIVYGAGDSTIKILNLEGHFLKSFKAHGDNIQAIKIINHKIISGSRDSTLKIWDLDGTLLRTLQSSIGPVSALDLAQGKLISSSYLLYDFEMLFSGVFEIWDFLS